MEVVAAQGGRSWRQPPRARAYPARSAARTGPDGESHRGGTEIACLCGLDGATADSVPCALGDPGSFEGGTALTCYQNGAEWLAKATCTQLLDLHFVPGEPQGVTRFLTSLACPYSVGLRENPQGERYTCCTLIHVGQIQRGRMACQ